jgi:transposase
LRGGCRKKGSSGGFKTILGMSQNFVACDRDQSFLLPPSLRDWVPAGHLVWTVLAAVEEMDLSAFYRVYRSDGHGRPAYDPSMMVALLLYAYARGNRSSRGIERECVEDVAYRVICANLVPDHSTIADFRKRHEAAVAGLFGEVLSLCKEAGLVSVGVIAVDGTKVHANASRFSSVDYQQLARKILEEADQIDREEDELYGDARGDELPEQLQTPEGRREALGEAKRRLAERAALADRLVDGCAEASSEPPELDRAAMIGHRQARRGWMREARHQLDEQRRQQAEPIPRSRVMRLLEAERRMQQDLAVERAASEGYDAWRAERVAGGVKANRVGGPSKPYEPPVEPPGKINVTDPDSRNVKSPRGWVQGYNAQAVVNENHIVIAAEITIDSPDFGHLEPMITAAERELEAIGISERPQVALGDAGYWHQVQMQNIAAGGTPVLVPPDASKRAGARPGWNDGMYAFMRRVLATELGAALYRRRQALVEPVFAELKFNRKIERFQRRGRSAVNSEWRLVNATHNLLKLHRHQLATVGA